MKIMPTFIATLCIMALTAKNVNAQICRTILVSARGGGTIEEIQSIVLGSYVHHGYFNRKPYYIKRSSYHEPFKLFYRKNVPGIYGTTLGWIIGTSLEGNTFYVTTRNTHLHSPVGITGAYDRDITYDSSFKIECQDNLRSVQCCSRVTVQATGCIQQTQSARLGLYTITGQIHNGHPVYSIQQYGFRSYLFFRKTGTSMDGWIIGPEISSETFAITTRMISDCPNEVVKGFDVDKYIDDTFRIFCSVDTITNSEPGSYGMKLDWMISKSSLQVNSFYDASSQTHLNIQDHLRPVQCCTRVTVQSTGCIQQTQSERLGLYTATGQHYNGHPVYSIEQYGYASYLFFQRTDGWIIGPEISSNAFAITTRTSSACPNTVVIGYDVNNNIDDTFRIFCSTNTITDPDATDSDNDDDHCCQQIFVSACGPIEVNQNALLGMYSKQKDYYNGKPYYVKPISHQQDSFKFFYRKAVPDTYGMTLGWIISTSLEGNSFYVTTRNTHLPSPIGITGAYDRDTTYDSSFKVECQDNLRPVQCCSRVTVQSTGCIQQTQSARLGLYTVTGQIYNGYPVYSIQQYGFKSFLFFQKTGTSMDGWTISHEVSSQTYAITSRMKSDCPDKVVMGYDVNKYADDTFRIFCFTF